MEIIESTLHHTITVLVALETGDHQRHGCNPVVLRHPTTHLGKGLDHISSLHDLLSCEQSDLHLLWPHFFSLSFAYISVFPYVWILYVQREKPDWPGKKASTFLDGFILPKFLSCTKIVLLEVNCGCSEDENWHRPVGSSLTYPKAQIFREDELSFHWLHWLYWYWYIAVHLFNLITWTKMWDFWSLPEQL